MVVLLQGVQLTLLLRLGTQLSVLDHLWIKITIWTHATHLQCIINYSIFMIHVTCRPTSGKVVGNVKTERHGGDTSELLLGQMQGVAKVKVLVVKEVAGGGFLLSRVVVGELRQELAEVLSLSICQHFAPGVFTQHREENVGLFTTTTKNNSTQ